MTDEEKTARKVIATVLCDLKEWGMTRWGNPRAEIWADSINDYARENGVKLGWTKRTKP